MIVFIVWEFRVEHPLVNLRVLGNRNFALGTLLITIVGVVLYSTTALLPLFLQALMGYPALNSGMAISPRGIGAIIALMVVGRLVGKVDARLLMTFGFCVLAFSCWHSPGSTWTSPSVNVMWPNVISGLAMGFVFVPVDDRRDGHLPNEQMGNATGIFNLMRNIGGSFGISLATTLVARGTQAHQAMMVGHLTPLRPAVPAVPADASPGAGALRQSGVAAAASLRPRRRADAAGRALGLRRHLPRPDVSLPAVRSAGVAVSEDAAARRAGGDALAWIIRSVPGWALPTEAAVPAPGRLPATRWPGDGPGRHERLSGHAQSPRAAGSTGELPPASRAPTRGQASFVPSPGRPCRRRPDRPPLARGSRPPRPAGEPGRAGCRAPAGSRPGPFRTGAPPLDGLVGGGRGGLQAPDAILLAEEGDDGVFRLLVGLQHGVLVGDDGLSEAGILGGTLLRIRP